MKKIRIRCNQCGFEATNGEYDVYRGDYVENGVKRRVVLQGAHPYRLNRTHVCDRFEYGTFKKI